GLFSSAFRFKLVGSAVGAAGLAAFAAVAPGRLTVPLLLAAGIPLGQSLEGLAGSALYLRSRYDIRSVFLAWSMGLRLAGVAGGAVGLSSAVGSRAHGAPDGADTRMGARPAVGRPAGSAPLQPRCARALDRPRPAAPRVRPAVDPPHQRTAIRRRRERCPHPH